MDAGSTFHPAGTSRWSLACTGVCMLLRTLTSICDFAAPDTGTTTTGVSSSTESGGPTARGRSDCPLVGSMNFTLAVAYTVPVPPGPRAGLPMHPAQFPALHWRLPGIVFPLCAEKAEPGLCSHQTTMIRRSWQSGSEFQPDRSAAAGHSARRPEWKMLYLPHLHVWRLKPEQGADTAPSIPHCQALQPVLAA